MRFQVQGDTHSTIPQPQLPDTPRRPFTSGGAAVEFVSWVAERRLCDHFALFPKGTEDHRVLRTCEECDRIPFMTRLMPRRWPVNYGK